MVKTGDQILIFILVNIVKFSINFIKARKIFSPPNLFYEHTHKKHSCYFITERNYLIWEKKKQKPKSKTISQEKSNSDTYPKNLISEKWIDIKNMQEFTIRY